MAVYDLEEQDQLDDLKAWWARWGTSSPRWRSSPARLASASRGGAGTPQAGRGGVRAVRRASPRPRAATTCRRPRTPTAQLEDKFARTGYAPRGALVLAKLLFDSGDAAGARDAAAVGDRQVGDESRAEGDRPLSPGRGPAQRQAVRRGAEGARRQARRRLRRPVRRPARRRAGRRRQDRRGQGRLRRRRWPSSTRSRRTSNTCR